MQLDSVFTLLIVAIAYGFIIFGRKNKAAITFGLALVIAAFKFVRGIEFENISRIVDFDTLSLLTGMMIIVAFLSKSGFFEFFSIRVVKIGGKRFYLTLSFLMIIVALTSAFLDNVVTILVMTPMIFLISDILQLSPIPLVMLTLAMDNIGGAGTLIGSPLNLVIGSISGYSFNDFIVKMGPVAIFAFVGVLMYYKRRIKVNQKLLEHIEKLKEIDEKKAITDSKMMVTSVVVFLITVVLFMLHSILNVELGVIALLGGTFLIIVFSDGYESVAEHIDWDMLFFFAGLYIMSYALEEIGVTQMIANTLLPLKSMPILSMMIIYGLAILTVPILNNVPAALIIAPVIKILVASGFSQSLWWTFAIGANFVTNLTPLGAVQNIVAVNMLEKQIHRKFGFIEFVRWMITPVLISLVIGFIYNIFI
ncbi:citrate transporter [Thermosipho melanesiensis]|uniref:Citrate transporter n=2 Tax=Thermosipho melanesiensis TaxID=46541 RepID=A6LNN7_THEM4|nr:SLC13 family permease [Thermosipho melanesiensis]ABR31538.1 Citrate transporter [Thermosipho melanesiensis BI429]APT74577.1 citrate transporter [Thermosipho melanesiensis]OOC35282.1 citrate transporter [Thermosipho melanesiensis]OOC35501.1 citrate transporter [Thermosipho melanesiensis]OOC36537.1 citrate transporter [Thermosipho melanesiensis]